MKRSGGGLKSSRPDSRSLDQHLRDAIEFDYLEAERSLAHFFRCAWRVLEPNTELQWNWHFDYIIEHLEAVELGQIRRLLITLPPRSAKSNLVTVAYPAWVWVRKPHIRFIMASYSGDLSTKHSVDRRNLLESAWFQQGFGSRFQLASDQNQKTAFMNTRRGHMIATSITGTATGKGCNRLIIDDPINPKMAESKTERDGTNRDYDSTFPSRLDDKKKDAIIGTMQRTHTDDWVGHVKGMDDWVHVDLPAEAQEKQTLVFPLSQATRVREVGALLHPEREGPEELASMKRALGSRTYGAQYNQRPSSQVGNIIKRHWLKFYDEVPPVIETEISSWDMKFGVLAGQSSSSYVAGLQWGTLGARRYLLDAVRRQIGFTESLDAIRDLRAAWPKTSKIVIENKANGPAAQSVLEKDVPGIVLREPEGDKVARLYAVSPQFEAGNIYLPNPAMYPWVKDYIEELVSFPDCPAKDQVDATSQALRELQEDEVGRMRVIRR